MEPQTIIDETFDFEPIGAINLRNKTIHYIKSDIFIGNRLKNGIYWEEWMFKYIQENYIPNTNMIDLGGNIGTTTLLMSEVLSDNCKIYTFEPIYNNITLKNVLDNNLQNSIEVYPYGIGNKEEIMSIKPVDLRSSDNFGGISIINQQNDENRTVDIKIFPLDVFHFENVSLIKIDVEHMEILVLEGAYELIKKCKPTIIIETYQLDTLYQTEIYKNIVELGYKIEPLHEGCCDFIMKIQV